MMELGLSLGDAASRSAAPSYGFVKEGDPRGREKVNAGSGNPKKRGLGFCMALAIGSSSPPPPESHQKQEQNEIHGDDDDDQRVSPELHLLPLRPPPEGGLRGFDVNRFPPPANTRYPPEEDESGAAATAAGAATSPSGNSAVTTTSFPHQMDFFRSFDPKVGSGAHTTATTTTNNNKRVAAAMRGGSSSSEAADTADTAAPAACSSRGVSDEEDHNGLMSGNSQKKLRLSKEQAGFLEDSFKHHTTLTPKQKLALAKQLDLRPRQVEVWFQNRRARTKLKQTEVDCEYLKRCCETLTEENRRLHKEVQELRALKSTPNFDVSNPFSMHLPATTLTMCPSCERTSAAAATAATTSATTNVASKSNAFSPGTRLRLH